LEALLTRLGVDEPEFVEATGLLGRAWKQIFLDSADKTTTTAHSALLAAVAAYRGGHERDHNNTWHGVNLLALVHRARQMGLAAAPGLDLKPLAMQIMAALEAKPKEPPDEWLLPTLAEASLGLGDWEVVETWLRKFLARPDVPAFLVASTLRQFSQVWNLEEAGPRGRGLVNLLRARLLQLPKSELRLSANEIASLQSEVVPSNGQLEAVLGRDGQTYEWWMAGLRCARSVASIKRRLGSRVGTGFLVRAGDFGVAPADEFLVLTNFHVVNREGQAPGVPPADAQVVFEATAEATAFDVAEIVWTSPPTRQDSSLLRLRKPVSGVEPLRIAAALPTWPLAADDRSRPACLCHRPPGVASFRSPSRTTRCSGMRTARGQTAGGGRLSGPLPGADGRWQLGQSRFQRYELGGDCSAPHGRATRHATPQRRKWQLRGKRRDLDSLHHRRHSPRPRGCGMIRDADLRGDGNACKAPRPLFHANARNP
jgi:hypothetical protein